MASWKIHLVVGAVLTVLVLAVFLWQGWAKASWVLLYAPGVVFVGTLLPDIDHHNGMLRTLLIGFGILLAIAGLQWRVLLYVGLALAAVAFIMPFLFPHRGFIHSIIVAVIYGVTALVVTGSVVVGGIATFSFWTHLLLDKIPFKLW